MTILAVPYVSQVDSPTAGAHRNDCGPACVTMLVQGKGLAVTIADVYAGIGSLTGDPYINGGQLARGAAHFGLVLTPTHMTVDGLRAMVDLGHPYIALIKYGCLSDLGLTESVFTGPHFVLVVGFKGVDGMPSVDAVVVHDPLYRGVGGKYKEYAARDFWRAWTTPSLTGNPTNWGLRAEYKYPALDETVPVPPPAPQPLPPYWGTGVTLGNLKLRRYAPDGPVIDWLLAGTDLTILEAPANGWYHVRHGLIEGWSGAAYIRATPTPLPEPLPPPSPGSRKWDTIGAAEKDALLLRLLYNHGMVDVDGVIVE